MNGIEIRDSTACTKLVTTQKGFEYTQYSPRESLRFDIKNTGMLNQSSASIADSCLEGTSVAVHGNE